MKNKQKEIGNHEKNKKNIQKAKKLSLENKHQADTIKTRRKPGTKQRWRGKRSMKKRVIATFLSVLELIKSREIVVYQDLFFDDILIKKDLES